MALISAHRGGAGRDLDNTVAGIETAIALGCDFVEFDVRVTADARAVLAHDEHVVVDGVARSIAALPYAAVARAGVDTLDDALEAVRGRIGAHVDLKASDRDLAIVLRVIDRCGTDDLVVTTSDDADVRAIARWAEDAAPGLRVALSTAIRTGPGGRARRAGRTLLAWFPRTRVRRSGATAVAAHHRWARWWLRDWAHRRGLPLLVWTVDDDRRLAHWLADPLTWVVTTNRPARAMQLRLSSP
jgi:glycerophosphoryl diester phosphodiesterase